MNYYLLSVTNDFASDSLCKEIAISLSPIVDSPNLKFHYTRNQIIFSFGAETEKSEIYEYITGVLYGLVEIFVLTEIVDDFSVSLPKDIKDHLFDLENVGENVTMKLDMERIKKNLDFSYEDEDDDDDDDDDKEETVQVKKEVKPVVASAPSAKPTPGKPVAAAKKVPNVAV
jgi:hypothetical protein